MDSNQVAKASDAARVLKLNTASFSEARNRYTASMPCKSRSRNEVGGAAALGDLPAAAAGTVAFLVAVAMILHLPGGNRSEHGPGGLGSVHFGSARQQTYSIGGSNREPDALARIVAQTS